MHAWWWGWVVLGGVVGGAGCGSESADTCPIKINGVCCTSISNGECNGTAIDAAVDAPPDAPPVPPDAPAALTPGLILVGVEDAAASVTRYEVITPAGTPVRTYVVPRQGADGPVRDLVVGMTGIYGWSGTFTPRLAVTNATTGATTANTGPAGWSTVANVSFGGIASLGTFIFATDMATVGGTQTGLVRFDAATNFGSTRFAETIPTPPGGAGGEYIDVVAGFDGGVYALRPGTSPGGFEVDVWVPGTLAFVKRVVIGGDHRAIAVDGNGDIFAITAGCELHRFDPDGAPLGTLATVAGTCGDLDLDATGRLVTFAQGATDQVILADRTLAGFEAIPFAGSTAAGDTFVAWSDPR